MLVVGLGSSASSFPPAAPLLIRIHAALEECLLLLLLLRKHDFGVVEAGVVCTASWTVGERAWI
jgi:hypothetical protein